MPDEIRKGVVTCVKLADAKISVRLDGKEVCILPRRQDCSADDLEDAIQEVVDALDDDTPQDDGW